MKVIFFVEASNQFDLEGYGMNDFILGTQPVPAKFIPGSDGELV